MKNEEIRSLTEKELQEKIEAEQDAYQKLKFAHAISPVENPMKIRETRRRIARLKTEKTKRTKNEA